jgi:uncharacterized surface protein with fasciclin (FAS1) repeats
MKHRFQTAVAAAALLTVTLPLSAQDDNHTPPFDEIVQAQGTVLDVATGDQNFSTLVAAVQAAGLAETLQGPGPFTVFAPTNDAFAQMPQAVLDALIANPDQLSQVVQYHAAQGQFDVRFDYTPRALGAVQGQNLYVDREFDDLRINNAKVVGPVIQASNGVIYVIDSVLLPQYRAPEPAQARARKIAR